MKTIEDLVKGLRRYASVEGRDRSDITRTCRVISFHREGNMSHPEFNIRA